ncbi:hypothetical protein A2U01_0066648, partial [Trifolium medium]|nr:hypothetical protein [Trifolium medium]
THDSVAYQSSANIPHFDPRPTKKSKVEKDVSKTKKDMAKLFETMSIQNTMLSYLMQEHQIFRTWLVNEFCPAMHVTPPPENPAPPAQEIPKFDSSDDSSPNVPQ